MRLVVVNVGVVGKSCRHVAELDGRRITGLIYYHIRQHHRVYSRLDEYVICKTTVIKENSIIEKQK